MLVVLAAAMAAVSVPAASPASGETTTTPQSPLEAGVHVIGDSITDRAHNHDWSPLSAERRPRGWTVDAYPGRRVTALGVAPVPRTRDRETAIRHVFTMPRHRVGTAVIALGTNGADEAMTVADATRLYAQGIRLVRGALRWRGPKRVVLVTPWKDPSIEEGALKESTGLPYEPYQWASKTVVYRKAIHRVARATRGVCVMPWHTYASAHPARFRDGIHPDRIALRVWRRMLERAIRTCAQQ
ncbi:GDSL-type esterase/lipase family protein [Nocardioides caeni]|uniref:SGNH hydrolase-type esterase domain-containing protein n=1 Tax=Nocardioides caeni TaxID=574700 RepID=A0A4S8NNQ0_9ACTN|nr:GDSL-type esterase/lipase family protein [Nocardioides caeni]THV18468.1 hypothetical protein E9934_02260 [Nocardioides caeni]